MGKSLKCTAGILRHEYKGYVLEKCDAGPIERDRSLAIKSRKERKTTSIASLPLSRSQASYWRIRDPFNVAFVPEHEKTLLKAKARVRVIIGNK